MENGKSFLHVLIFCLLMNQMIAAHCENINKKIGKFFFRSSKHKAA